MTATPLRSDDGGAFDRFYTDMWPAAARWAYGLTGNAAAAEELTQEAFVAVHRRFSSLHNPHGYLRRTIVNLARGYHRASGRRERREQRAASSDGVRPGDEPAVDMLDALALLPYDQRAALVLRYWLDWDEASIASALSCARSTVRSHAKRGLDALRTALEVSDG